MKLVCTPENFKKAIYNCERVVSKRNTLPILNNILFEAEKGGLKLSATNLEIGVTSKVGAKIEDEGKITIPARIISNFSSNLLGAENIEIELSEDKLKIRSGTNKAVIKGLLANDYPLIPTKKTEYFFEISGQTLKKVLSKVNVAVAINEARQELTGIDLVLGDEELYFASTDSFRLVECRLKLEKKDINEEYYRIFREKKENVIIPFSTMMELARIIPQETESRVKVAIEEGQIFFEVDSTRLVSRLINGKYPEYKHIMPKDYKTRIVGEKGLFQNAVKLASIFSSGTGGSNEIVLKIESETKKTFVRSQSVETGENSTELNFDVTGPDQEIVFNAKYLLDGINISNTEKVALLANSEMTPVAIKEIDAKTGEVMEDFTYIVMPIKN